MTSTKSQATLNTRKIVQQKIFPLRVQQSILSLWQCDISAVVEFLGT